MGRAPPSPSTFGLAKVTKPPASMGGSSAGRARASGATTDPSPRSRGGPPFGRIDRRRGRPYRRSMSPPVSLGEPEQSHGTAIMQPANDFIETPYGSAPSLAGLLADALGDLPLEQTGVRSKIASALRMVGGPPTPPVHTGGLAPWQVKRLEAHIEARLETLLRLGEAATLVGISSSHFSRAFKRTYGQPFSRYVRTLRLERARGLLNDTDRSISDIALACGMSDQPHLTRLFHRRYGAPPHAWRRAHRRLASAAE